MILIITRQCAGAAAGVEVLYVVLVIVEIFATILSRAITAGNVD